MEFVSRWFSAQPSARGGLLTWLKGHPSMREIARTPLVAALMCSLYDIGEKAMPMSETDLYEKRLDFLLGRWEEAKHVEPMKDKARSRYRRFLMNLAASVHERQMRYFDHHEAQGIAARYLTPGVHRNAAALIQDCVKRGLIVEDYPFGLTLGHLAHQEFLVAQHMQKYNDLGLIGLRLGNQW